MRKTIKGLEMLLETSQRPFMDACQTIAQQANEIEHLRKLALYSPNHQMLMAMFSTNKLARKMVERFMEKAR